MTHRPTPTLLLLKNTGDIFSLRKRAVSAMCTYLLDFVDGEMWVVLRPTALGSLSPKCDNPNCGFRECHGWNSSEFIWKVECAGAQLTLTCWSQDPPADTLMRFETPCYITQSLRRLHHQPDHHELPRPLDRLCWLVIRRL